MRRFFMGGAFWRQAWGLVLALGLTAPVRAATIGVVGAQIDDGASWRTAASNKVYDIDGNHVLGSDGYELVNRPQAKPAYVSTMGMLTGTYPGNSGYALLDDPTSPPATFTSGTMNPYIGAGVWADLYTFTMNTNVAGRTIRVGLLVDNLDLAYFNSYRMALAQTGAGGTTAEVDTTIAPYNNRGPDWIFFNISGAVSGDVFTVRGMGGSGVTATLGGLAFDSAGAGTVRYVAPSGSHTFPYTNWLSAATNLQDAIDASPTGSRVLVSNGVYDTGGRPAAGSALTNRVTIDRLLRIESVNGPTVTTIAGQGPVGDSAVRCVWMMPGASLSGFTLTNGAARSLPLADSADEYGSGLWAASTNALVSNCVVTTCSGIGAVKGGSLVLCDLLNNTGGGAHSSALVRCRLAGNVADQGGGAYQSTLVQCSLVGNTATGGTGGGASLCTLSQCLLAGNASGGFSGGGASGCTLYNCTVTSNKATYGAGTHASVHYNSIVWGNVGSNEQDGASSFAYSCTRPLPPGTGNINADPLFVNAATGNYRIVQGSPCVNVGDNASVSQAVDLDGATRIKYGTVDLGAYEMVLPTGLVHYVVLSNATPAFPYQSWTSAAPDIQTAVEAASAGSSVLVSNGVYATGVHSADAFFSSRRVVARTPITLRSINGPSVTVIDGGGTVGGVSLTNGASLAGFTITNGRSFMGGGVVAFDGGATVSNCVIVGNYGSDQGGGFSGGYEGWVVPSRLIDCDISGNSSDLAGGGAINALLTHCTLRNNQTPYGLGGGAYACSLDHCVVEGNVADDGGGVYSFNDEYSAEHCLIVGNHANEYGGIAISYLRNCTVVSNSAVYSIGGAYCAEAINSIVKLNSAPLRPNSYLYNASHSCVDPAVFGSVACITNDPVFVNADAGDYRLALGSPCINAGEAVPPAASTDLDGNPRVVFGRVDMGAYEYATPPPTGLTHYAVLTNATPVFPYTNWLTAAPDLQLAVDAARTGSLVLVSNGVYTTGGRPATGSLLNNRVLIDKPLVVRSVNGPAATWIGGAGPVGDAAVRCVWLADGATLDGFTLSGGATRMSGDPDTEQSGGGLWAPSWAATATNCEFRSNLAYGHGGGARSGTILASKFLGNQAYSGGGGASASSLSNCLVQGNSAPGSSGGGLYAVRAHACEVSGNVAGGGGGAALSELSRCTIVSNQADYGGGVDGSAVENSLLAYNHAEGVAPIGRPAGGTHVLELPLGSGGGGASVSALTNCTVTANTVGPSVGGGGTDGCTLFNCIVVNNTAPVDPNYAFVAGPGTIAHSCASPLPPGTGNLDVPAGFVNPAAGDFRLQPGSLCVNAGNNAGAPGPADLGGLSRIALGTVDLGAYEYDGSGDGDTDGFTDIEEYIADTQATNALSYFRRAGIANGSPGTLAIVFDQTSTGRVYSVFVNTNLLGAPQTWTLLPPEQTGTAAALTITITNALPAANYRTGVRLP